MTNKTVTPPKDAYFAKIKEIKKHPNADKLDLAYIDNWQVCVPKGMFNVGQMVLYICTDTVLPNDRKWCEGLLQFTQRGRIKPAKIRSIYTSGMITTITDDILDEFNTVLSLPEKTAEIIISNAMEIVYGGNPTFVAERLGILHYEAPVPKDLSAISTTLPYGLSKTDESNWEAFKESELPIGEKVLITKKMDGSSGTFIATPEGEFTCCSRKLVLKPDSNNNWTEIGKRIKERMLTYAAKHNTVLVVRGELVGHRINEHKNNLDSKGTLDFYMFKTMFPQSDDFNYANGHYGTDAHFVEVAKELDIKTVPIIGEVVLTVELLKEYANAPKENGEGVVINHANGSFKAKSIEYDM